MHSARDDVSASGESVEAVEGQQQRQRQDGHAGVRMKPDKRNRKMLGSLIGHLHSAKNRIESEIGPVREREDGARRRPLQPRLLAAGGLALKRHLGAAGHAVPRRPEEDSVVDLEAEHEAADDAKQHKASVGASKAEASQRKRLRRAKEEEDDEEEADSIDERENALDQERRELAKEPRQAPLRQDRLEEVGKRRRVGGTMVKRDPRSKNLFFKMLGHLHSAKKKLESDVGVKRKIKLKAQAQAEAARGALRSDREFEDEPARVQLQQQPSPQQQPVQPERSANDKEMVMLRRRLENHYSCMMNFIRTKAEPTIFYLPAKHTPETESKLEETRDALRHKISSLKAQLRPARRKRGRDAEEASSSSAGEDEWVANFPEEALQQAIRVGLNAQSANVLEKTSQALVVEYEGGSYGQGRHNGFVQLSGDDLRIYDGRYPGKYLSSLDEHPLDAERLLWCLRSPNWDYANDDKR